MSFYLESNFSPLEPKETEYKYKFNTYLKLKKWYSIINAEGCSLPLLSYPQIMWNESIAKRSFLGNARVFWEPLGKQIILFNIIALAWISCSFICYSLYMGIHALLWVCRKQISAKNIIPSNLKIHLAPKDRKYHLWKTLTFLG